MQFGHALPRGEEDRFSQPYRRTVLAPPHTTHKTHTRARTHIHTLHHTHASAHTPLHSGSRATTWIMNAMTFHIAPTVGAGGLLCFVSKYRHPSPHRPQLLELGLVNAIICHQARRPAQRLSHSSPTPLTLPLAPYPTHPTTRPLPHSPYHSAPILSRQFGWQAAVITNGTLLSYVAFTISVSGWRTKCAHTKRYKHARSAHVLHRCIHPPGGHSRGNSGFCAQRTSSRTRFGRVELRALVLRLRRPLPGESAGSGIPHQLRNHRAVRQTRL